MNPSYKLQTAWTLETNGAWFSPCALAKIARNMMITKKSIPKINPRFISSSFFWILAFAGMTTNTKLSSHQNSFSYCLFYGCNSSGKSDRTNCFILLTALRAFSTLFMSGQKLKSYLNSTA